MAERNIVPNLEAKATDENQVFAQRQWRERFRQFCKREHKIDITPLLKGEEITNWSGKEQTVQEDFIWGVGPEALYRITRAEYKTEPDSIKIPDLIRLFTEFFMPKRNTYNNRGNFFWAKQTEDETPEEFWRRLIEIDKECKFNTISAGELLISKHMRAITDKKITRQNNEIENYGNEENNRTNQTEHVRKEKQKEYNSESPDINERKTHNERRTNTKNGTIWSETEEPKFW